MKTLPHKKHFELSLPSQLGYEVIALDTVASFVRQVGFDPARIDDLKTALGEVCINAIEHGNRLQADLRIDILCVYTAQMLLIEVHDYGVQRLEFDIASVPLSIEDKMAGLGPPRGLGLHLIQQLVDEVSCTINSRGGNCFRLVWYQTIPALSNQNDQESSE
jgi:serine/threonine-protein kinase RsbW